MTPPDLTEQAGRLPYLLGLTQETVTRELIEAAAHRTGAGRAGRGAFGLTQGTCAPLSLAQRARLPACVIAPRMTRSPYPLALGGSTRLRRFSLGRTLLNPSHVG